MTVNTTAYAIQANSHPADSFRRALKAIRATQGVVGPGDMAVTQNGTPNMSVNIAAGSAVIDGTQNTTTQGTYQCINDATVNLTIAASDPTNPRIDIVCISIQDAQYSGAANQALLQVVTGTPAPSPSAPATPANSILLAQVSVAANSTTVVNANITDKRTFVWQQIQLGVTGLSVLSSGGNTSLAINDSSIVTLRNALNIPTTVGGSLPPTSYGSVPLKFDEQTGTGSTSITIPATGSIPSGFRAIRTHWKIRTTSANVTDAVDLRFNGDSGTNYRVDYSKVESGTASGAELAAQTQAQVGIAPGGGSAGALLASGWFEVPFYTDTNNKTFTAMSAGADSSLRMWAMAGVWFGTAAITSMTLFVSAGNYSSSIIWTELLP